MKRYEKVICCLAGYMILCSLFNKNVDKRSKLLILLLIFAMPAGMNLSQILSGVSHDLMHYALWMFYVFVILITGVADKLGTGKRNIILLNAKSISIILIFTMLFGNVRLANELYLKKDLEQDAIISLYTRVWNKMESVEGYNHNTTPVVFIGEPEQYSEAMEGFENSHKIVGGNENYSIGSVRTLTQNCYRNLFRYKFHYNIVVGDYDVVSRLSESEVVEEMPEFPKEGSIKLIDGILVIKMGR